MTLLSFFVFVFGFCFFVVVFFGGGGVGDILSCGVISNGA